MSESISKHNGSILNINFYALIIDKKSCKIEIIFLNCKRVVGKVIHLSETIQISQTVPCCGHCRPEAIREDHLCKDGIAWMAILWHGEPSDWLRQGIGWYRVFPWAVRRVLHNRRGADFPWTVSGFGTSDHTINRYVELMETYFLVDRLMG